MQSVLRSYTLFCIGCVVLAASVTAAAHLLVPLVGNPWSQVVWFITFVTIAELLMVSIGSSSGVQQTSPASPVHWAATCVLGPVPAVAVCLISGTISVAIRCIACYASRALKARYALSESDSDASAQRSAKQSAITLLTNYLTRIGAGWQVMPLILTIEAILQYLTCSIINVGLAGMAYYALGGHFLISADPELNTFRNFIFPFFGLVITAIVSEHSTYIWCMSVVAPSQEGRGLYGIILRAKLAFIDQVSPVLRGQMFLIIVALILSYLYVHIGVGGLVLTIMPVLALRDFFNQWVEERTAYVNTITTLATYMQHYHPYTRGHLKRVAEMSERLARELKLPAESVKYINTAGFLHDIGKIGVSEEILDKIGKLTDDEWNKIKEHPVKGAEIINHLEFLETIVNWIKYHHKWHNGAGYPSDSSDGKEIPIEAAIIAVADSFDAMTDDRELTMQWKCDTCGYVPDEDLRPVSCPKCGAEKRRTYREPKTLDEAINELRRGAGTQFHPKVVKAFLAMVERDGIHLNA